MVLFSRCNWKDNLECVFYAEAVFNHVAMMANLIHICIYCFLHKGSQLTEDYLYLTPMRWPPVSHTNHNTAHPSDFQQQPY